MDILLTAIVFILILSVLVLVHEFGHFWMAKRAGIKVEEFGFGLPPRLWGKKKGETIYSINWIPFGGFVKMYGEDSTDKKVVQSGRSFIGKTKWQRTKVIVAGVVMNFFLAWLLLTIAMTAGMKPLLTPDQVMGAVKEELIILEEGLVVREAQEGSVFEPNDVIISFNGQKVDNLVYAEMLENPEGEYVVNRGGELLDLKVSKLNAEFYDAGFFQRLQILGLDASTDAYGAGLRPGDFIISLNKNQILDIRDLYMATEGMEDLVYHVYRDGKHFDINVEVPEMLGNVVVADVIPDSPADEAGIKAGDKILLIEGQEINNVAAVNDLTAGAEGKNGLAYVIDRDGERLFLRITPDENKKIGVYLSNIMTVGQIDPMQLFQNEVYSSIVEIKDVKYSWYEAPVVALKESIRLSLATANMIGGLVVGLFQGNDVPDTVAGPVGIAQMTHLFVQEGFIALLQFVAVLSLSLAVINILPFPALDGGRLLFIIIEAVTGRRVNQRFEAYVHALGYALILLLILIITYNDILRLL